MELSACTISFLIWFRRWIASTHRLSLGGRIPNSNIGHKHASFTPFKLSQVSPMFVRPTQYVGDRWRTSGPKIIDNAVVAFCREHGLESTNRKYQRTRITRVRVCTSAPLVPMESLRTLDTLGSCGKRKTFKFSGSINTGVVLQQSGKPCIDAEFFRYALQHFGGKIVYGGFKQDGPPRQSFGEWVQDHSKQLNSRKLTARHGSFMAAILCDEAGVRSSLESNRKIILEFPS